MYSWRIFSYLASAEYIFSSRYLKGYPKSILSTMKRILIIPS